jgi:hypothetical protein
MGKKAGLLQRIADLEAQLAKIRVAALYDESELDYHTLKLIVKDIVMPKSYIRGEEIQLWCHKCGYELERVGPEKWQCNYCDIVERDSRALAAEIERKNPGWKVHYNE